MKKNKEDLVNGRMVNRKDISKTYSLKTGDILTITIKDALFGEINGQNTLLDEIKIHALFNEFVDTVSRNRTIYNPIPKSIIISHSVDDTTTGKTDTSTAPIKEPEIARSFTPRWSLEDVCVDEAVKNQIVSTLTIIKNQDKLYNEWGLGKIFKQNRSIVLNFYGKPGTGKTMMAEAIAYYLGKKVYQVNYAELESKYVGETPKNIVEVFKRAQADNAVLVFDEADSFLGKRLTNVSQSADYGVNITRSVMLMEIESYEGVVIFTTNLITNYDDAFKRRILASVEFKLPGKSAREQIWKTHIPDKLPMSKDISPATLGEMYEGISGADIKDMLLNASVICLQNQKAIVDLACFDLAYEYIKKRYTDSCQHQEVEVVSMEEISPEQYKNEMGTEAL